MTTTEETGTACGWCRDPYCNGDHSGDRAEPFVIDPEEPGDGH
jgi:hypothetical protein